MQTLLRKAWTRCLDKNFRIVYEELPANQRAEVVAVLDIMSDYLSVRSQRRGCLDSKETKRLQALKRLKLSLCGPISGNEIAHFCPSSCHHDPATATQQIEEDIFTLSLNHPACVPVATEGNTIATPCR